jgi:hypothetical protein
VAVRRALRAHQHHVIEQPLTGLEIAPGRPYRCAITLDAASGVAEWRVDGHLVHDVRGVEIPTEFRIGMGLITLHPIVDGRSRSLRGQGLTASFGPISLTSLCDGRPGTARSGSGGR